MASNNHWLNWPLERFPAEFHTALAQGKPDHPILLEWPARWKAGKSVTSSSYSSFMLQFRTFVRLVRERPEHWLHDAARDQWVVEVTDMGLRVYPLPPGKKRRKVPKPAPRDLGQGFAFHKPAFSPDHVKEEYWQDLLAWDGKGGRK